MFRVLDIPAVGPAQTNDGQTSVGPPPSGTVRWVDLEAPTEADAHVLRERFGFHPLALEDCLHLDQRPKLEPYDDYLFVVIQGFCCPTNDPAVIEMLELHAFISTSYLVTVHADRVEAVETVRKRLLQDPAPTRDGPDFLYYLVADQLVDSNFPILDQLTDALEEIEDTIVTDPDPKPEELARIFALKRSVVTMRKTLSPHRDVFALLTKQNDTRIKPKTTVYLRDIYDHLVRIYESIDTMRDLLGNALDAYLSMLSNRTNDIMKRLTVLSAIFLPLSFVTGFFGQNFEHLPFKSDALMFAMIAACFAIPGGMLYWFYRSKWL